MWIGIFISIMIDTSKCQFPQAGARAFDEAGYIQLGMYNNYTICGNTGSDKVISYPFIVISAGGPHQTGWRAIFIHNAPGECLNPYIKGPPPL